MTPRELCDLIQAMGDAVPFGEDIVAALDERVTTGDHDRSVLHWAGAELEAYRVSIGLDARPAASSGNEHLDWLTDHLT